MFKTWMAKKIEQFSKGYKDNDNNNKRQNSSISPSNKQQINDIN